MSSSSSDMLAPYFTRFVDQLFLDPGIREQARSRLLQIGFSQQLATLSEEIVALKPGATAKDSWTIRARPAFLYVMYAMILSALPIGLVAVISPSTARAISDAMNRYLAGLPEPLYTLFGTGYLGYATLRQWGKVKGTDR
jgi:hypothetical protein